MPVHTLPSGSPYDTYTPPIDYSTPSPGFNTFSTPPSEMIETHTDWTNPSMYGLWDNADHALYPVHPHVAGLSFPTARSRECAHVKDLIREGVVGMEAMLPFVHESLHESIVPTISAPSASDNWYERQYQKHGQESIAGNEDYFEDAEDGEEVEQQTQALFDELEDLPEGNLYGQGSLAARSSFRYENQEAGNILDALPAHLLQDDDSGRRSSFHFESYGAEDYASQSGPHYPYDASSGQLFAPFQQQYTQEPMSSFNQAFLPPRPPTREVASSQAPRVKQRSYQSKTEVALNDMSTMHAWETYKLAMNAPQRQADVNDFLWKRFLKYKTPEIIQLLNSGDSESIAMAKSILSYAKPHKPRDNVFMPERNTWSEWAKVNYNEQEFQKLIIKCCQLCQASVDDIGIRTHWRNRLLRHSSVDIITSLRSRGYNDQMWAIGQLEGYSAGDVLERQRRRAAANATQDAAINEAIQQSRRRM